MDSEEKVVESDPEKSEMEKDEDRDGEMTPEAPQKIIAERTAERKREAEVKRLEGLRRIAAMKSGDGIDPLDLFPKEIWLQIMGDKGLSSRDRYNLRQVHPLFRDLTEDSVAPDILLPLAMNHQIPLLKRLFHSFDDAGIYRQIKILENVSVSVKHGVNKWLAEDLRFLQQISASSWNVQKMTIWIKDVSMGNLFQSLEKKCPNLEHLSLHLKNIKIGEELNFLRLPCLKNLEIELEEGVSFTGDFHHFFALHFLMHCGNLESLKWTNHVHEADYLLKMGMGVKMVGNRKSKRLIDFQSESGVLGLNKSNIWNVLPRLKYITVKLSQAGAIGTTASPKEGAAGSLSVHRGDRSLI